MAYLGSGSAEWANAPRAVLAIRSMGSHDIFELNAGKRGSRLNWRDDQDVKVYSILIQHSKEPGQICWVGASKDDLEPKGRPKEHDHEDMLDVLKDSGLTTKEWIFEAREEHGIKEATFYRLKKAICASKKAIKSHVTGKWMRA